MTARCHTEGFCNLLCWMDQEPWSATLFGIRAQPHVNQRMTCQLSVMQLSSSAESASLILFRHQLMGDNFHDAEQPGCQDCMTMNISRCVMYRALASTYSSPQVLGRLSPYHPSYVSLHVVYCVSCHNPGMAMVGSTGRLHFRVSRYMCQSES